MSRLSQSKICSGVEIIERPLDSLMGLTDGSSVIVLNSDMTEVEKRCAYAHELAHISLGHVHSANYKKEAQAKALAARWLIPMDGLLEAICGYEHVEDVAESLGVTVEVLVLRTATLSQVERTRLKAVNSLTEMPA